MSWASKLSGHDARKRKKQTKVLAQQRAPGGVLDFQSQIDTAGGKATGRGEGAQDQYLATAKAFDPTASIQKYASAQWDQAVNDPDSGMKRQLSDLGGRSVGAGRLDTGFYDQDQGQVFRDVTKTFGNQVASTAVTAAQMGQENNQNLGEYGERQSGLGLDVAGSRYDELQQNAKDKAERARAKKRGIGQAIGAGLGAVGGAFVGDPIGGAQIGAQVGGGF